LAIQVYPWLSSSEVSFPIDLFLQELLETFFPLSFTQMLSGHRISSSQPLAFLLQPIYIIVHVHSQTTFSQHFLRVLSLYLFISAWPSFGAAQAYGSRSGPADGYLNIGRRTVSLGYSVTLLLYPTYTACESTKMQN